MQHLHPNSTLQSGKYKIEKVLGQGGFGITYLAYNNYENKYVAIKEFFLKELCGREESTHRVITHIDTTTIERFKAKFLKEARTLMSFSHRNIVRVFDCFEENNTAYYVMEYIQGSSISDILRQHGSLDERTAVSYIRKVAAALQYIHGMNINHLDVKPGNILLRSQDNEIALIDFGTAKHYDTATGGATTMTQAGYSQGYAAIEQYRQGGVSTFTPETDIYSLGATLYKMLTNQTPPEPSLIIENGLPTMPSWISSSTKSAITAAMQINKQNRPHSIPEFLQILDGDEATKVVDDETRVNPNLRKGSNRPTPPPQARNSQKNNKTLWWWIAAVFVVLILWFVIEKNKYTAPEPISYVENNDDSSEPRDNSSEPKPTNTETKKKTDVDVLINMFLKDMRNGDCARYDLFSEIDGIYEETTLSPDNEGYSASLRVALTSDGEYLNKRGSSRRWTMRLSGSHYGAKMLHIESGEINDNYKDSMKSSVANALKGRVVKSNSNAFMDYTLYQNDYGYYAIVFDWGASAMWMHIYASTDISVLNQIINSYL